VPGADVTNTSFHRAVTLVIKAADKRYWHEEGEENFNQICKIIIPNCEKLLYAAD
jgi:hypothetical protein